MKFQTLYLRYCNAVAFIEVETRDGVVGGATAYHIGDGIFITARHVLEDRLIRSIQTTTRGYHLDDRGKITLGNKKFKTAKKFTNYDRQHGRVVSGPYLSETADVAAVIVEGIDAPTIVFDYHSYPYIFDDDEIILSKVLVLGYPPVAFSDGPRLVAAKAEINTVIDKYTGGPPHFIVSAMARGGFSGGPCLTRNGLSLGMVSESLILNDQSTETGFLTVVSIRPIISLLIEYNIVPRAQESVVDFEFFNWRRPDSPGTHYRDSKWLKEREAERQKSRGTEDHISLR